MDNAALSDLIARIYDCALDPERWTDTVGRIAKSVRAPFGVIAIHDLTENRGIRAFAYGIPAALMWLYGRRDATRNPIAIAARSRFVEGTVDTSRRCSATTPGSARPCTAS
jgi:hypothetical protein